MPLTPQRAEAIHGLLRDLGPWIRQGAAPTEPCSYCPTGIPALDRLLGGGIPRGRLSEVVGPASSGRTSLALALLSHATRAGDAVAVVDADDAFDPTSAEAAGVDLSRVLWVRAPHLREALRGTERLLEAHGFGLVWLDLEGAAASERRSIWARLERAAAGTNTALLVLGSERRAGTSAEVALELSPVGPRFTGTPPLLEALESDVRLVRRRKSSGGPTAVRLRLSAA